MAVPGLEHMGFLEFIEFLGPRVIVAVICGGLIGLERELKNKAAGMKTNMLICLGATLYSSVSILISASFAEKGYFGDPARVAAQIVSGIGFLGGGAILQSRGNVLGLTTAATIWVVAAIGICVGLGYLGVAVGASLFVVVVLVLTRFFEHRFLGRSMTFRCEVQIEEPSRVARKGIKEALEENDLYLDDFDYHPGRDQEFGLVQLTYKGHRADHKRFVLDLWNMIGVREVKQK